MKDPNRLYLARNILGSRPRYFLRQSVPCADSILCSQQLFDLGEDPETFIIYIGDNGYYISDELIDAVQDKIQGDAGEILEELLWPFVDPEIRRKLESFMNRGYNKPLSPVSSEEKKAIDEQIHIFDRRRLHYLWYGSIDQTGLYKMPDKLCRKLLGMSRDEKEQYFIRKEQVYAADEIKDYLYTIFNLQEHFTESFARSMPQGLNQEKMDDFFVEALCKLDRDKSFWKGVKPVPGLQPYLTRYLIFFFDYGFSRRSPFDEYLYRFMNSRRKFSWPERKKHVTLEQASAIFDTPADKLTQLSRKELTKLYRQRAKNLHPDTPDGEHDEFVKLTEAYEELLVKKN